MKKMSAGCMFVCCLFFSLRVLAKHDHPIKFFFFDKTISGTITDSKTGDALAGVSVQVKNTTIGTVTDVSGAFKLAVPDAARTLVISNTGYASQEITIGNKTSINIQLQATALDLDEVVVIGYGTQKKKEVTASIASVKSENFVKGAVNDAGQLLQGKVAGLSIATPTGSPVANSQIILRGINTINSSSQPLVLVDGIPGNLRTVAPEDIESIDVLKDGAAAAIYGTRGTNGVILITTRKSNGKIQSVEYSGYVSTQVIARRPDMLTAEEYREKKASGVSSFDDQGASTDWLDEIIQKPLSHVHNLTYRGGTAQTNYLVNLNYRYFEGIMMKSDNRALSGRFDVNHSMFNGKLKANFNIINTDQRYNTSGNGNDFNGYTYRQALIRNPTSPVKNPNGSWNEQTGIYLYENPISRLQESDGENSNQNTRLAGTLTLAPLNGLTITGLFARTKFNELRGYSETKRHISNIRDTRNGYASRGTTQTIENLMELTANYSKSFGEHSFSVLGGYSYQDNTYEYEYADNWDFPTDLFTYNNLGIGDARRRGITALTTDKTVRNLIGFFGRATYSYKDKYLLMASMRHEATSALFGAAHPWGTFPAVSVGWRINKEDFMKSLDVVEDLKLRIGYGVTGSPPQDLFLGVARLGYSGSTLSNGRWVPQLVPISNPNPNLRWEEKAETNIGLDFTLFKGRLSGSFDVYKRKVDGLLYQYSVPTPPNLFGTTWANVGVMENKGIEAIVNFTPITRRNFEWTSSVNFSTNSNKLVSLSNEDYKTTTDFFNTGGTGEPIQTYTHRVKVGRSIGEFYGFKVIGIDDAGKWIYEGSDGKAVAFKDFKAADEDKKVLGNGLPKYYAGWNNNFRYKKFDLAITMRGAFKFQILNFQRMYYENTGRTQYNQLVSAYDKVFGKMVMDKSVPLQYNSYYIENGDFWKIDNITLGYNVGNIKKVTKNIRVYFAMLNSVVITKYKGIDPEVSLIVNNYALTPGNDDRDKYPSARTFTFGANVTF
ncbi:MAG: SusC/RagA family TonB-linked outer membrane protein [Chitinophagaceae bacterium]